MSARQRILKWLRARLRRSAPVKKIVGEPPAQKAKPTRYRAVKLKLTPQPWRYENWGGAVYRELRLPPPTPAPIIYPQVYGRAELPPGDAPIKEIYAQKPLDLNLYGPCLLLPRNLVLRLGAETTVLPPTFFLGRHKLHGAILREPGLDAYTAQQEVATNGVRYNGTVYHADADHPHVYGHVLIDFIAKLWAYKHVPKGTPLATSVKIGRSYGLMISQLGIDPDKIVPIDQPIIPNAVFFPGIAFGRRDGLYPQAFEVFDKIGRLGKRSQISVPERIYVARTRTRGRSLVNELEMEAWFNQQGFVSVHPQELPIEDQIAIFARAKMIAGPAGSAMHNAVFSPPETKILLATSSAWLHLADIFISRAEGSLGFVFGDPLTPPSRGHSSNKAWSIEMDDVRMAATAHFGL